jgi:glycosyltransferase involved in cell wall biosynthesis
MFASVVVTTYNRPDALAAVLRGLAAQQDRDFEVLIADDGSTDDTRRLIEATALPVPLAHVWQEDCGFRAAAARNRAVAQARGDYLLFLDGDCVPRPDWLAAHRRLAEPGWMVAGNRILLSRELTANALDAQWPLHQWTLAQWRVQRAAGGINRTAPLLDLPLGPLRKLAARRWQRVRTCNLGVWRANFERVNGLDEDFVGWGYEDSDLAIRLIKSGVRRKEGAYATGVLHLWHAENPRAHAAENWQRLQVRLRDDTLGAARGLAQHR